jgi:fido (protein-threonine AMPylation protein)
VSDLFEDPDDATPLTPEERRDLIPAHITFRRELNEAEQENIARGQDWALASRRRDILTEKFIKDLQAHMCRSIRLLPRSQDDIASPRCGPVSV